jgi:hypothetical protein
LSVVWNINANSVPDLDDWGWDDYWSCPEWIQWHKAMVSQYGAYQANEKFLTEWNKQSIGAHALDCRSFNSEFREYTKAVGLHDALYNGALLAKPLGITTDAVTTATSAASDVVQAGGDLIQGVAQGAGSLGKSLKYVIPVLLIVALGVIGFIIYKKTQRIAA